MQEQERNEPRNEAVICCLILTAVLLYSCRVAYPISRTVALGLAVITVGSLIYLYVAARYRVGPLLTSKWSPPGVPVPQPAAAIIWSFFIAGFLIILGGTP